MLDGSDGTPEEKQIFDEWLRKRWEEKDQLMLDFAKEGSFMGGNHSKKGEKVVLPLQLRRWWEYLDCFSFFLPVIVLVAAWYLLPALWTYARVGAAGAGAEAAVRPCCAAKAAAAASKLAAEKLASGKLEL